MRENLGRLSVEQIWLVLLLFDGSKAADCSNSGPAATRWSEMSLDFEIVAANVNIPCTRPALATSGYAGATLFTTKPTATPAEIDTFGGFWHCSTGFDWPNTPPIAPAPPNSAPAAPKGGGGIVAARTKEAFTLHPTLDRGLGPRG